MKIAIIGGSISGCAIAALLNQDFDVQVFERSTDMSSRGAGITISPPLFASLIEHGLIDATTAFCNFDTRSFHTRSPKHPRFGLKIWQQPVSVQGMHWEELYQNLRKRVPSRLISYGKTISDVRLSDDSAKATVLLSSGEASDFDLVIFADGVHSIGRNLLNPDSSLDYSGYIAWRGIIPFEDVDDKKPFIANIPYYCYDGGHLLAYLVQYQEKKMLNWVFYEKMTWQQFEELGIENYHDLSPMALEHLHQLSTRVLSSEMSKIVNATKTPFVQPIKDIAAKTLAKGPVCTLGDASMVLRPHVGNGASMAIEDALALSDSLKKNSNLSEALQSYQDSRLPIRQRMLELSQRMATNLVLEPLPWLSMNAESMDEWWNAVLKGESWYTHGRSEPKMPSLPH